MALHSSVVLDLSGLETGSLTGAGVAIAHVQMCLARGKRVIAVVGTPAERAARDLAAANRLGPTAEPSDRAAVLAAGATETAENFASVLRQAGLDAAAAEPELWPTTRGHALDAEPRRVSGTAFETALTGVPVVVVPGGVGRDVEGTVTSLGAATSTLTAVFLADRLALPAERPAREFTEPDATVGSRKAERFADRTGVRVRTVSVRPNTPAAPTRIAAFGDGPVASVVAGWGTSLGGHFEYERFDATPAGAAAAKSARPDVILDFSDGADASYDLASWALRTGRTVISTNASLIAERGGGLSVAALIGGGTLRASGAIGGCPALAPVIERFATWPGVRRVQGSFSPLADRVLDLRGRGVSAEEAEATAAAELGLDAAAIAKARSGEDAMTTLGCVAQLAFGAAPAIRANARGPEHVSDLDLARAKAQGRRYRVIATAERIGEQIALRVGPVPLRSDDPLASETVGAVEAVVESRAGHEARASGRLQHPGSTAAAVLRDLIDLGRVPSPALYASPSRTGTGVDPLLGVTA